MVDSEILVHMSSLLLVGMGGLLWPPVPSPNDNKTATNQWPPAQISLRQSAEQNNPQAFDELDPKIEFSLLSWQGN